MEHGPIVPMAAIMHTLSGFDRDQLGSAVEVLIALMDLADGDPDAEIEGDAKGDQAWAEWSGYDEALSTFGEEDDEDSDPDFGVDDRGELDAIELGMVPLYGVDQSEGPINEVEEHRALKAEERTPLQWGVWSMEHYRVEKDIRQRRRTRSARHRAGVARRRA
jgi:hypothetical protein